MKTDQAVLNNWYAHPETGHTADNVCPCSGSDDEWNPGQWRPIPLLVSRLGSEQFVTGLDDGKHASGAYPTKGQLAGDRAGQWPLHNIGPFPIHVLYDGSGCVWLGIILHQYGLWPHSTGELSRNSMQNFIVTPSSCQSTLVNDM